MPGQLSDGAILDLQQPHPAEGWESVPRMLQTIRMRRYLDRMVRPPRPGPREIVYLGWVCDQWNVDHAGERKLERVRLLFTQRILRDGDEPSRTYRLAE